MSHRNPLLSLRALPAAALIVLGGLSSAAAQPSASAADQQYMKSLGEANVAEIETGKLAQAQGQSQDVKSFGAMMVRDHTEALQKLQTLASSKGVQLPSQPDAKHASAANALKATSGEAFDRRYASMAVTDHEETLALLKKVQAGTKDKELRSFAGDAIPVVSGHLDRARKLK